MDYYIRLQNAVNFIEENLNRSFSLTEVSKSAFSSLSYLHRVFYFMTGYTVKEYIRKRRLSHAAYQLHCTNLSITEIAFNSGYETLESFIRAFKKHFNMSPRTFRKNNQEHRLFDKLDILGKYKTNVPPQLDFNLSCDFVLYKEVIIRGFQIHTTLEGGQQATDICNFATNILESKKIEKHFTINDSPIFGVYTNMSDEAEFDYTIGCLESTCVNPSDNLISHTIPTSQYAKFTLNRIDRIKEAWDYIYGSWFPQTNHCRSPGFDFEIYQTNSVDIYIPLSALP